MGNHVLPRAALAHLQRVLGFMPVAVLMGARQTGKSTLVRDLPGLDDRRYVTLDDALLLADAHEHPDLLVRQAPRLTIDEVQRAPDLVLSVKRAIDEQRPREPGRFVLTGSANLLLMSQIKDSLAGRASYVTLWPLTRREQLGLARAGIWSELFEEAPARWYDLVLEQTVPAEDWRALARRGGHPVPAVHLTNDDDRRGWFAGYVSTYLQRDLRDLAALHSLSDFTRVMRLAALRVGNLLNISELARDARVPRTTVDRYLDLLEISYQLVRLEAFSSNRTTRLIKTPKVYWSDTGLALSLTRVTEPEGAHLENLVLSDLLVWRDSLLQPPEVMYWRTASRREVDFVVEYDGELLAIEVKAGSRPSHDDARHLRAFQEGYGRRVRGGLLLHDGTETFWVAPGVLATPWWRVI